MQPPPLCCHSCSVRLCVQIFSRCTTEQHAAAQRIQRIARGQQARHIAERRRETRRQQQAAVQLQVRAALGCGCACAVYVCERVSAAWRAHVCLPVQRVQRGKRARHDVGQRREARRREQAAVQLLSWMMMGMMVMMMGMMVMMMGMMSQAAVKLQSWTRSNRAQREVSEIIERQVRWGSNGAATGQRWGSDG